jgi:hypothetical protein
MAKYALVENNEIVGVYETLPTNWKNISNLHVCDEEQLKNLGWHEIIKDTSFDPETKVVVKSTYEYSNDNVYETCEVYDKPQSQPSNYQSVSGPSIDERLEDIRMVRDQLMKEFDWRYFRYEREIRLGLEPTDKIEDLDLYMNSLADITKNINLSNIDNVNWPKYEKDN